MAVDVRGKGVVEPDGSIREGKRRTVALLDLQEARGVVEQSGMKVELIQLLHEPRVQLKLPQGLVMAEVSPYQVVPVGAEGGHGCLECRRF